MASISRRRLGWAGAALMLVAFPALVSAQVALNLCADINTSSNDRNISIYQTNGLCKDFCGADWAYAITQYNSCWCSDYTPEEDSQVDLDECNTDCPAYPPEKCGGRGLYGYIELIGKLPSGTIGDDETTSTSTDDETSAPTDPTASDGDHTAGPGEPTETGDAEGGESGGESGGGGGLGGGAIAGIVIGIIAAIGIGAALAFFFLRRRNKGNDGYEDDPSVRGDSPRTGSAHPDMSMGGAGSLAGGSNSNRNSTLQIDPRMDPFNQGLYMRNGSHESINTLQDNHDYSRRILRATNPDAE